MRGIPWRVQLGLVAACYAAVLTLGATLIIERYLLYVRHPEDVAASSGMYAFGDLMLEMFIAGALLVPTILLVLVVAKSEAAYATYSKVLFALSLSAPLSFGLLLIPSVNLGPGLLGYICLYRLEASPFALAAIGFSRMMARFSLSKRLTSYALLTEAFSLIAVIGIFAASVVSHTH
jgi:hypothetical protein